MHMRLPAPSQAPTLDAATAALLRAQYAAAERIVNYVRMALVAALGVVAVAWSDLLTRELTLLNGAVLGTLAIWSFGQHLLVHRNSRPADLLVHLNPYMDITAVSCLLLGYGLLDSAHLSFASSIFAAYFIVLAARAFTGPPSHVAHAALLVIAQYAAILFYFAASGRLDLYASPVISGGLVGASLLDETARIVLIALAGIAITYAATWNERTLHRSVATSRDSQGRFRAVFEHAAVGIAVLDPSATILEINRACGLFLGADREDLIGCRLTDFASDEDTERGESLLREVAGGKRHNASAEIRFVRMDGTIAWASITVSSTDDRRSQRLVAMLGDATERKTLEAQLRHRAYHDSLTELANRALFRARVEHALERRRDGDDHIAVLFLDLDNFKAVNDTHGHLAGDSLLGVVAERLLGATRGCDTVARLGGDEFAVLLEPVNQGEGPHIVADRIMAALRRPIAIGGGRTVEISGSIGIATSRGARDSDELLRNADTAMYEAKRRTRGCWAQYAREGVVLEPLQESRLT